MTITNTTRMTLKAIQSGHTQIKGVVFDMDGTLCKPQTWMFGQMRSALGLDKGIDLLTYVHSLPEKEQEEAQEILRKIERKAMVEMIPQPGLNQLMDYLDVKGIPKAICTRNFPVPVDHLLTSFLPEHTIGPIITRDFMPTKPHPAGILHIAEQWGISAKNIIMVGDSIDDMEAGDKAGAATILIESDVNDHIKDVLQTDVVVQRLDEIIFCIENGFDTKN
ncbi:HAD-like protein [Nadsonia fulvescens var. elongata DSM 6958]|uniref:HAD-like protein n=1 Tax=Nadsonia fulvescens var. elongata DSM 6958 TaxID=857566 RepID=A0A1E3PU11_9ASCO|nr:HAD-like protein [Nadsonia fulvescens var. elongata DSM 6958]